MLYLEHRSRGRARYSRVGAGTSRRRTKARLGFWKYPCFICITILVLLSLGLPIGNVLYWTIRGITEHLSIHDLLELAFNSGLASTLAAGAAILVAIPVTILETRRRTAFSTIVEAATYSGYALPGIVLALSLVFFAANFTPIIYQTLLLLIVAYVLHFIPAAIGPIRTSLLQLNPHLPESARLLGHSQIRTFIRISLPILRPGIGAAAALVFLNVMKELPATLLLSPTGFSTLATSVWSFTESGMFAAAGPPALLLLLVASIPMVLLLPRLES